MRINISNKIDITKIFTKHFDTLRNANEVDSKVADETNINKNGKKLYRNDVLTFFIIPIIPAIILIALDVPLSEKATNVIISTLSILIGLLFNVVVILFDIIKRDSKNRIKNLVLEETHSNISYIILISIIIIGFTLLSFIDVIHLQIFIYGLIYYSLTHYLLTVLMILKRIFNLFDNELKDIQKENSN